MDASPGCFYELDDPFEKKALRLTLEDDWVTGKYRDKWLALAKGEWLPVKPLVLKPRSGHDVRDFLWSGSPLFCVSTRLLDILLEHRFTGWATYPVEVYDNNDNALLGYRGFSVKGLRLERDLGHSKVITNCIPGGKPTRYYRGLYFDEKKWDGADFFWVNGATVVTGRVARAIEDAQVTNVAFTALPEVEMRASIVERQESK